MQSSRVCSDYVAFLGQDMPRLLWQNNHVFLHRTLPHSIIATVPLFINAFAFGVKPICKSRPCAEGNSLIQRHTGTNFEIQEHATVQDFNLIDISTVLNSGQTLHARARDAHRARGHDGKRATEMDLRRSLHGWADKPDKPHGHSEYKDDRKAAEKMEEIELDNELKSFEPKVWVTLGPVVQTEAYSDPLAAFGGIRAISKAATKLWAASKERRVSEQAHELGKNVSDSRYVENLLEFQPRSSLQDKLEHFPSEYGPDGRTVWSYAFSGGPEVGVVTNFTAAAMAANLSVSGEITPSGWAIGEFILPKDTTLLIQCSGFYMVDEDLILEYGDVYSESRAVNVYHLKAGVHRVYVMFSTVPFWCDMLEDSVAARQQVTNVSGQANVSSPLIVLKFASVSDVVAGNLASPYMGIPVQNVADVPIVMKRVELIDAPWGLSVHLGAPAPSHILQSNHSMDALPIASNQVMSLRLILHQREPVRCVNETFTLHVRMYPQTLDGLDMDAVNKTIVAACVSEASLGFKVTFPDFDGSVQQMWVAPPNLSALPGGKCPPIGCPLMLSLHGASVEVGPNWGRNYAINGTISKSFPYPAWLVEPSNRHAFGTDWEGQGYDNAFAALSYVQINLPSVPLAERDQMRLDLDRMLVTGHSMGGHGCLLVSGRDPDRLVGSLCGACWTSQARYAGVGGSGLLDQKEVGHLRSRENEWAADFLSVNMRGIPFRIVYGQIDDNVPPQEPRYISRLIDSHSGNSSVVEVLELPKTGHWFQQNIPEVTSFLGPHLQPVLGEHELALPPLPESFEFVVPTPSSFGTKGGLKVLQLSDASKPGRFVVRRCAIANTDSETSKCIVPSPTLKHGDRDAVWYIESNNVRRFNFSNPRGRLQPKAVILDGVFFDTIDLSRGPNHFCLARPPAAGDKPLWGICKSGAWADVQRGGTGTGDGPLHNVLRRNPLCIVHGGLEHHKKEAIYLANKLFFISQYAVPVIDASQKEFSTADIMPSYCIGANLVLIGHALESNWTAAHRCAFPYLQFHKGNNGFTIGGVAYQDESFGFLGMGRLENGQQALLVFGTDARGLTRARQRVPASAFVDGADFMVLGHEAEWSGEGGVLASGYLDHLWQLSTSSWAMPGFAATNGRRGSYDASMDPYCEGVREQLAASDQELLDLASRNIASAYIDGMLATVGPSWIMVGAGVLAVACTLAFYYCCRKSGLAI